MNYSDCIGIGRGLISCGLYNEAISNFTEAIKLHPDTIAPYCCRGFSYYKKGIFEMALCDFNKAIELKSGIADLYYLRGIVYTKVCNYTKALEDFWKALELNPDLWKARINIKFTLEKKILILKNERLRYFQMP